jgi:hypothetical protein
MSAQIIVLLGKHPISLKPIYAILDADGVIVEFKGTKLNVWSNRFKRAFQIGDTFHLEERPNIDQMYGNLRLVG